MATIHSVKASYWGALALVSSVSVLSSGCSGSGGANLAALAQSAGGGSTTPLQAVVSAISPATGFSGGGTLITITGTNFQSNAAVTVGGQSCSPVTVVSSTQLTCTTTAASATSNAPVVVTNTSATPSAPVNAFTFQNSPTISSVSESGGTVTVSGFGFYSGATITLTNGQTCSLASISADQTTLTCTLSGTASAGSGDISIANAGYAPTTRSDGLILTPTITNLSSTAGSTMGGYTLTLTGAHYFTGETVTIGGVACSSPTVTSSTQMSCTVPAHAAGAVSVVVSNGAATSAPATFTYQSMLYIAQEISTTYSAASESSSGVLTGFTGSISINGGGSSNAFAVATHPSKPKVYLVTGDGNLGSYSIGIDGTLALSGTPATLNTAAYSSAVSVAPNGNYALVIENSGGYNDLLPVPLNAASGNTSATVGTPATALNVPAGSTQTNPTSLAITSNSSAVFAAYLGSSSVCGFTVSNTTTGALTQSGSCKTNLNSAAPASAYSVALDSASAFLYASGTGSGSIYSYSVSGASLTLLNAAAATMPNGNDVSLIKSAGGYLFIAYGSGNITSAAINSGTGALGTLTSPVTISGSSFSGLDVDPSGNYLYVGDQTNKKIRTFSIGAGGALTPYGSDFSTGTHSPLGFSFTAQ